MSYFVTRAHGAVSVSGVGASFCLGCSSRSRTLVVRRELGSLGFSCGFSFSWGRRGERGLVGPWSSFHPFLCLVRCFSAVGSSVVVIHRAPWVWPWAQLPRATPPEVKFGFALARSGYAQYPAARGCAFAWLGFRRMQSDFRAGRPVGHSAKSLCKIFGLKAPYKIDEKNVRRRSSGRCGERALRRRRRSLARSRARCVAVAVEVAGGYIARHARYARRAASRTCTRMSPPRIARVIAVFRSPRARPARPRCSGGGARSSQHKVEMYKK